MSRVYHQCLAPGHVHINRIFACRYTRRQAPSADCLPALDGPQVAVATISHYLILLSYAVKPEPCVISWQQTPSSSRDRPIWSGYFEGSTASGSLQLGNVWTRVLDLSGASVSLKLFFLFQGDTHGTSFHPQVGQIGRLILEKSGEKMSDVRKRSVLGLDV